jgi:hypothetical protein
LNFEDFLSAAEPYRPPDLPDVSLIRVIANPELFDRKVVRLKGFLELEFEGNALYFHHTDWEQMLSKNAVWLDVTREIWERGHELARRYVLVEGVFRADFHGHMNMFSGAITNIDDIRPMPSRKEIEEFLARERAKR